MIYLDINAIAKKQKILLTYNMSEIKFLFAEFPKDNTRNIFYYNSDNLTTGKVSCMDIRNELETRGEFSCFVKVDNMVYMNNLNVYNTLLKFGTCLYYIMNLNNDILLCWHNGCVYALKVWKNFYSDVKGLKASRNKFTLYNVVEGFAAVLLVDEINTKMYSVQSIQNQGGLLVQEGMLQEDFCIKCKNGFFEALLKLSQQV